MYRTYRETKEMFQDELQDVGKLAGRVCKLLNRFKGREGALEALRTRGVFVHEGGKEG